MMIKNLTHWVRLAPILGVLVLGSLSAHCYCLPGEHTDKFETVNAADITVPAQDGSGPFGEVLRATGPMAKANPFRFSTKYQDDETDPLYYGYRYYNASTGRWLSRDPIDEKGGQNLYGFVRNTPTTLYDKDGRMFRDGGGFGYVKPCKCAANSIKLIPQGCTKTDNSKPTPNTGDFYRFSVAMTYANEPDSQSDRCCKLIQWVKVNFTWRGSDRRLYSPPASPGGVPYDNQWHIDSQRWEPGDNPCTVRPSGAIYPFGGDDYPGPVFPPWLNVDNSIIHFDFWVKAEVRDSCKSGCPVVAASNELHISINGLYPTVSREPPL